MARSGRERMALKYSVVFNPPYLRP
jgi:hypothetical protein